MDNDVSDAIDQDEAENHLKYISAAMDCETPEERAVPLSEGLVLFGARFLESLALYKRSGRGASLISGIIRPVGRSHWEVAGRRPPDEAGR